MTGNHPTRLFAVIACITALVIGIAGCSTSLPRSTSIADGTAMKVAILESTDVHANIVGFDYYRLNTDDSLGYDRLATLVRDARREFANTLLFDAGDTIQGSALADWQARAQPLRCDAKLAMYKAMDVLGYDAATIGNHEFNYGLPFLAQVTGNPGVALDGSARRCQGPAFPLVLSNVFDATSGKPLFAPFLVLDRKMRATTPDGRDIESNLRIGVLGFTPPPILTWDRSHLAGKVITNGLVEAAHRYLPALRRDNVDIVIAISHGGIDPSPYTDAMENANWHLAQVPGIDVLLLGHSHQPFPDPGNPKSRFNDMPNVDNQRGFIHGKPAVMGNFWGKSLGVIELALVRRDGRWQIDASATRSQVRNTRSADGRVVAPDPAIIAAVADEHRATIKYVSSPIGDSDFAMTSYFAEVGDVSALQVVNSAQREWVQRHAEHEPALAGIPVLSAAAPFKTGFGGATDFTDVPAGPLAIRNAADLYLFPNTIAAVRVDGAGLKAWLEFAARRFNRIDPERREPQELLNRRFPSFNFDVIQGDLRYVIDVSREAGERIVELTHAGRPVTSAQRFIVVTNNYRASGGGGFPGVDGSTTVIDAATMNRDALIDWIARRQHLQRTSDGSDRPWRFAPLRTRGDVIFNSAAGRLDIAHAAGLRNVRWLRDNDNGTAVYTIDLDPGD